MSHRSVRALAAGSTMMAVVCTGDDLKLDVNVLGTPHRLRFQAN